MVRGRVGAAKVGLFQSGTHKIADIPSCRVQHAKINEAAASLKRAMRATGTAPYAERPHRGLVRALQVVVERSSQSLQVVVVANAQAPDSTHPLLEALQAELGDSLHSLFWNGNAERTNTILGPHWQPIAGPESVCETIGGAQVFFPPGAFGQSHLALADRLVAAVHAEVPEAARVAEFHAGCGAIGLGLLARGQRVSFNEIDASSLRGLAQGLAAQPDARERAHVLPGAAGENLQALDDCDVAIVDPPRKGLEAPLCEALAQCAPQRLLYVSCDPQSLLRDAERLLAGQRLSLRRLAPYALFPFTEHVETLAVFERC